MGSAWRLTTILGGAIAGAERGGQDAAIEDEIDVAQRAAPASAAPAIDLIDCPCGCGLRTTGTRRCGGCGSEISLAHWDGLYDSCGPCADRLPDSEAR